MIERGSRVRIRASNLVPPWMQGRSATVLEEVGPHYRLAFDTWTCDERSTPIVPWVHEDALEEIR